LSSKHPIYVIAELENARAKAVLEHVAPEALATFIRSGEAMQAYKDVPNPNESLSEALRERVTASLLEQQVARLPTPRHESEAYRVVNAAAEYLSREGARRTARQITNALLAAGMQLGGNNELARISRVSAHLSASTKFNNDRAEGGYGLAEWPVTNAGTAMI
jgi:hypothetical protein